MNTHDKTNKHNIIFNLIPPGSATYPTAVKKQHVNIGLPDGIGTSGGFHVGKLTSNN